MAVYLERDCFDRMEPIPACQAASHAPLLLPGVQQVPETETLSMAVYLERDRLDRMEPIPAC